MNHRAALPLAFFLLNFVPSLALIAAQNKSPQDTPVAVNAEKSKKFEDAIAPYVKKARETLPEAKKNTWQASQKTDFFRHYKPLRPLQEVRAGFCQGHFLEGGDRPRNSCERTCADSQSLKR